MTTQQLRWYGVPEGEARKIVSGQTIIQAAWNRLYQPSTHKPMPSGVVDKLMAGEPRDHDPIQAYIFA